MGCAAFNDIATSGDRVFTNWHSYETISKEALNYKVDEANYIDYNPNNEDTFIDSPDDSNVVAIKQRLADGEVLTFSTYVYGWVQGTATVDPDDAFSADYTDDVVYKWYNHNAQGAHSMTVVGYNDHIWVDINQDGVVQDGEKGAFKIANSWGTGYANDGFSWLCYDALNDVSSVENDTIASVDREGVIWDDSFYSITVKDSDEEEHLYAAVVIDTKDRSQLTLSLSAVDENGTRVSESYYYTPYQFSYDGGTYSLTGYYMTHSNGVLVLDLNNVIPGITKEQMMDYSWKLTVCDKNEDGNAITIKEFKLVDEDNAAYYYDLDTDLEYDGTTGSLILDPSNLIPRDNVEVNDDSKIINTSVDVQMYNKFLDNSTNTIGTYLKVTNTGDEAMNLADLQMKYFFTVDHTSSENVFCDDAYTVNTYRNLVSYVRGHVEDLPNTTDTADSVAVLSFAENAGTLPVGESAVFYVRISNSSWQNYLQTNDYSFNNMAITFEDTDKVAVYYNDQLLSGVLPN